MRTLLVAALLLLLAIPAATAQMTPVLDLQVDAPTEDVGPEGAKVSVIVTLVCPNQAYVIQDQVVALEIRGPPGSAIDGPESVIFSTGYCIQQTVYDQFAEYTIKVPSDAPGDFVLKYDVVAEPRGSYNPVFSQPNPAEATFSLTTPPAPADETPAPTEELEELASSEAVATAAEEAAKDEGVADIPAPSWLIAVLGVALAAFRRR